MGKKQQQARTLAEAAQAPKRRRRTKKEMEAAKAQAIAIKRVTVDATYPAQGYPIAMCPVCLSPFGIGQYRKRSLPDLKVKHGVQVFSITRPVYPCSRIECKTDIICYISSTLNQRDILFFLDSKRLKGGKTLHSGPRLIPLRGQNTNSNSQPNTLAPRGLRPDLASPKRRKVKRK
jgi:hypothetical protein